MCKNSVKTSRISCLCLRCSLHFCSEDITIELVSRREARGIAIQLAGIVLIAGVVVLGVLQVRWVSEASHLEEGRIRKNLIMGATQALQDSSGEIQILLSLVRVAPDAYRNASFDETIDGFRFWKETAPFPQLLEEVYILSATPNEPVLVLSLDKGTFVPVDPPDFFSVYVDKIAHEDPMKVLHSMYRDLAQNGMVAQPILGGHYLDRSGASLSSRRIEALLALRLDEEVLYADILPFYLNRHLEGYPFRIIRSNSEETLALSDIPPPERRPDLVFPLIGTALSEMRLAVSLAFSATADEKATMPGGSTRLADSDPGLLADPLVRFWLLRTRRGVAQQELSRDQVLNNHPIRLEIFFPEGSVESVMAVRKVLNLTVSVGILALLLGSLVILYRLYRKTGKLRECEQDFVASMSHELRTPISVIQAASDNLVHGIVRDPGRLSRYASVIREQAKRLSRMVEGILLYSGLEYEKGSRLDVVEVDLPGLIEEVTTSLEQLAMEAHSRLNVSMESLPATIYTDPMAFRLVLENLVVNAIRHSNPGEIRLNLGHRAFDTLRITVEDDGPGIPLREQSRVFNAFTRGERSMQEQGPGSGLGLHLVRRMVGILGGTVTLESPYFNLAEVPRPGCRFTVVLSFQKRVAR